MPACVFLEAVGDRYRIATTAFVDRLVQRMGRSARKGHRPIAGVIVTADGMQARRLKRVLTKHWHRQYAGGGLFMLSPEDVARCARHFAEAYGLATFVPSADLGASARRMAFQRFARGRRSRWRGREDEFIGSKRELDALLAAGVITLHRRRSRGEIEYRGTPVCTRIARAVADGLVPERVEAEPVEARSEIAEFQMLPDPSMTDAEYFYQRQHKPGRYAGLAPARVNLIEKIGGFARFSDRTEAQEAAAQKLKLLCEQAQIGAAKAIDYTVTRVDTSGPSQHAVFEIGERARQDYQAARAAIGEDRMTLLERVIVHDVPLRKLATGGRGRALCAEAIRLALDDLAVHFTRGKARRKQLT